jgi:hypothetical protein
MIVRGRHEDKHYGAVAVGKLKEREIRMCQRLEKNSRTGVENQMSTLNWNPVMAKRKSR